MMNKKIALESQHQLVEIVSVDEIFGVYCGNPETSEDLITVTMKDGRELYCDFLNFDYVEGDYKDGFR